MEFHELTIEKKGTEFTVYAHDVSLTTMKFYDSDFKHELATVTTTDVETQDAAVRKQISKFGILVKLGKRTFHRNPFGWFNSND
jgi:hypothetical protein